MWETSVEISVCIHKIFTWVFKENHRLHKLMINELGSLKIFGEFESHWVPHVSEYVLK